MTKDWIDADGKRVLRGLHTLFKALKEMDADMPVQQMVILTTIALNEGKTQAELLATLDIPNSTMSRNIAALSSLDRLNKPGLGLIMWVDHPTDRRAKHLWLTPKGRNFLSQYLASV